MSDASAIGLNVQERESVDTPNVQGPPIGRLGVVFTSERGPVGVAVEVAGLAKAKRTWDGRRNPKFNSFYCMRGLSRNAKSYGFVLHGVRVDTSATTAAIPATVTGSVSEQFTLSDGDDFIVDTDNGGDQTAVFNATSAKKNGTGIVWPKAFAGGETLIFEKDNDGSDILVTFAAGSKSLNDVLAEINPIGKGYKAVDSAGQLGLESDKEGTASQIDVKATSTALALLGLTAGAVNGTGNVADIDNITTAEVKTIVEAATTDLIIASDGGKPKLTGTLAGATGEIDIKGGTAVAKLGFVVGVTNGTNAGSAAATPASKTFNRSATPVWTFGAGYLGASDPGKWANDRLSFKLSANINNPNQRDLVVYYKVPGETVAQEVETWDGLDASNVVAKLNSPTEGSEYCRVTIEGGDTGVPDATVGAISIGTGTLGKDATAAPTNTDYEDALQALNGLNIQLVGNFDLDDAAWKGSLESYCAGRGDVTGVFCTPQGASIATLKTSFGALRIGKSFTTGFRAYGSVSDGKGGSFKLPLLGHIVGAAFIRKARERGDKPHTAPAGTSTFLLDVQSVDNAVYSEAELLDLVNNSHVNPVVFQSKKGWYVKTSRSMSTIGKWVSTHTRLLTNHIKVGFKNSLSDFEQEGNNPDTRRKLRDSQLDFLEALDTQDAFEKEGGFENNVSVICDKSNNGKRVIARRQLVSNTVYRIAEIAEEVQINMTNTSDGILIAES